MLYHKSSIYLDNNIQITTLDVGQGDSILIKYPYNESNILIDTGGNQNSLYQISTNKIIPLYDKVKPIITMEEQEQKRKIPRLRRGKTLLSRIGKTQKS